MRHSHRVKSHAVMAVEPVGPSRRVQTLTLQGRYRPMCRRILALRVFRFIGAKTMPRPVIRPAIQADTLRSDPDPTPTVNHTTTTSMPVNRCDRKQRRVLANEPNDRCNTLPKRVTRAGEGMNSLTSQIVGLADRQENEMRRVKTSL
jgi:hypothetical protein